jgi:hypothetical protein
VSIEFIATIFYNNHIHFYKKVTMSIADRLSNLPFSRAGDRDPRVVFEVKVDVRYESSLHNLISENISRSGILIKHSNSKVGKWSPGDILEISIDPDYSYLSTKTTGKVEVVRVDLNTEDNSVSYGCKFL